MKNRIVAILIVLASALSGIVLAQDQATQSAPPQNQQQETSRLRKRAASFTTPTPSANGVTINAIFSQLNPSDPLYERFGSVLASPLIDGVSTALDWAKIDQGPGAAGGQYRWGEFDKGIRRFIDAGKKVNLLVQPISYGANNTATPSYVMNDPGLVKVGCQGGPGGAAYNNFPVVYENVFKSAYKTFIAEVMRHFADNPHIGYIRFGLSIGNEIFPECARQEAALTGLTIPQWRDKVWLRYDKEMMDYEKSLNPTMIIESPMTPFAGDPTWTDTEAANAVADGFGFGIQGLQAGDISRYPTCTGDWCKLFDKYAGQAPILELSTLGPSDPTGACSPPACSPGQRVTGPLPALLAFGVQHHATSFEIYPHDLLTAFDPKHPRYAEYHAAYANALAAAKGQ